MSDQNTVIFDRYRCDDKTEARPANYDEDKVTKTVELDDNEEMALRILEKSDGFILVPRELIFRQ